MLSSAPRNDTGFGRPYGKPRIWVSASKMPTSDFSAGSLENETSTDQVGRLRDLRQAQGRQGSWCLLEGTAKAPRGRQAQKRAPFLPFRARGRLLQQGGIMSQAAWEIEKAAIAAWEAKLEAMLKGFKP